MVRTPNDLGEIYFPQFPKYTEKCYLTQTNSLCLDRNDLKITITSKTIKIRKFKP